MIISNASSNSSVDGPGPLICDVWFPWRWIWEGPRSSGSWNPSQRPEGDIMDVRQNDNVLIQEELTRLLARACWEVSDLAKAFYFLVPYSAISRVYLCTAREFLFIQVSTKYPPSQSSKSGSSWLQNQHRRPAAQLCSDELMKSHVSARTGMQIFQLPRMKTDLFYGWDGWDYFVSHTQPLQLEETPTQQHSYAASAWNVHAQTEHLMMVMIWFHV